MTSKEHWVAGGVSQFIAASGQRVYVADQAGRIRVLDASSGATVDGLSAAASPIKFRNLWTDRIYLASPTGLIQCLHETAQSKPLRHRKMEQAEVEAVAGEEFITTEPKDEPPAEPEPGEESPFEEPAGGGPNPFE
jgi:hypothetical protein